ncbi:MAG TPA: AbrB/MazE/SpoVT family DNA-binding domain-containing protein [Candidatus Nanoarchaeia archaeon]|nr:AbrB/MazE/SpoVT family DNA-binding domain-containing protein [Candidatus Nanoarchaeia archaeon]
MVEFEITRLSSKGQIVIPSSMRKGLKEGEKIILIRDGDKIILKKASEMDKQFKEDLEFARRTEEAYKRIEAGEYIEMDAKDFLKEMKKW